VIVSQTVQLAWFLATGDLGLCTLSGWMCDVLLCCAGL